MSIIIFAPWPHNLYFLSIAISITHLIKHYYFVDTLPWVFLKPFISWTLVPSQRSKLWNFSGHQKIKSVKKLITVYICNTSNVFQNRTVFRIYKKIKFIMSYKKTPCIENKMKIRYEQRKEINSEKDKKWIKIKWEKRRTEEKI